MKRNSNLMIVFCFLMILSSLGADNGKPNMVLPESTFDAGAVYRSGVKLEHAFVVKNTGNANLELISVTPG